jgi:hypothetical protein
MVTPPLAHFRGPAPDSRSDSAIPFHPDAHGFRTQAPRRRSPGVGHGGQRDSWRAGDWAGGLSLGPVRLEHRGGDFFVLAGGLLGEPVEMELRYGQRKLEGTAMLGGEKVRLAIRAE